jgi:hypothetical protein
MGGRVAINPSAGTMEGGQAAYSHAKLMMKKFDVSYDAICSLCRLFEKEVELFRMIAKLIKKVISGLHREKEYES